MAAEELEQAGKQAFIGAEQDKQKVFTKIFQAYALRLRLLSKRMQLLQGKSVEQIIQDPSVLQQMKTVLVRERKILDAIQKDQSLKQVLTELIEQVNAIKPKGVLGFLQRQGTPVQRFHKVFVQQSKNVFGMDLHVGIRDIIQFLATLKDQAEHIVARIELEENILNNALSGNKQQLAAVLKDYFIALQQELIENEKTLQTLKKYATKKYLQDQKLREAATTAGGDGALANILASTVMGTLLGGLSAGMAAHYGPEMSADTATLFVLGGVFTAYIITAGVYLGDFLSKYRTMHQNALDWKNVIGQYEMQLRSLISAS